MRIDIRGVGFPLTAPLLDHAERRLRFALTRTSDRIKRVVVRLGDSGVDGKGCGELRFCRIEVYFEDAPPAMIEDLGAELYNVIDRAVERAGRNVATRIVRPQVEVRPIRRKRLRRTAG